MKNEAYLPGISPTLYFELIHQWRKCGDMRDPDEIIALAIKSWLAEHIGNPGRRGYQWKSCSCQTVLICACVTGACGTTRASKATN